MIDFQLASSEKAAIKIPKLLTPITTYEGAVRVTEAGADELYCDVVMPKSKHFRLYRGAESCLPSYDELEKVVKYAHNHGVKVLLASNLPFITESIHDEVKNHIRSCLDRGVDALIIGNMGFLTIVKSLDVNVPLYSSTYMIPTNYEAVDFLAKLGFSRIVLERHLTLPEITEIVKRSQVEIEVFVHGGGCSNINGSCYLFHHQSTYPKLKNALGAINGFQTPCRIPFDVYEADEGHASLGRLQIMDALEFCSLCRLPSLIETGITGLKIVDRGSPIVFQESMTRIYRECLDLLGKGDFETYVKRVEVFKDSIQVPPISPLTIREGCCEQERCFHQSLFHTPYKLPLSWHAWTKTRFKGLVMEKE